MHTSMQDDFSGCVAWLLAWRSMSEAFRLDPGISLLAQRKPEYEPELCHIIASPCKIPVKTLKQYINWLAWSTNKLIWLTINTTNQITPSTLGLDTREERYFFGAICLPSDIVSSICSPTVRFYGREQFLLEKALEIIDSTESSIFLVGSDQRICAV